MLRRVKIGVYHDCTALRFAFDRSRIMGPRRLAAIATLSHPDSAALKRGARMTARFAHRRVAAPAAAFVYHSVEGLFDFIDGFADSVQEVRKAMARARLERYTISAHRR
jgi:hypothetical protein